MVWIITPFQSPFPTFVTAAGFRHIDSTLLHAGGRAEFTLVFVGDAVAPAHRGKALARALRALALVPDADGPPGTNCAAACF